MWCFLCQVDDEAMELNKDLMSKLLELDDVDAVYSDQKETWLFCSQVWILLHHLIIFLFILVIGLSISLYKILTVPKYTEIFLASRGFKNMIERTTTDLDFSYIARCSSLYGRSFMSHHLQRDEFFFNIIEVSIWKVVSNTTSLRLGKKRPLFLFPNLLQPQK